MKNAMSLKGLVKNKAKELNVSAQLVLQNYFHERFVERVVKSKYRKNFVFKGGYLIGALVGLSSRTTMDMDATIVSLPLNHESVKEIFDEIASIKLNDGISFSVLEISRIRINDFYQGFRISLLSEFEHLKTPLSIDLTTGDSLYPHEREFELSMMFEARSIKVFSYSPETIVAEKLQTMLSRGVQNTRMRDFYDLHILWMRLDDLIDLSSLAEAVSRTFIHRQTPDLLKDAESIVDEITKDDVMQSQWEVYRQTYAYAAMYSFEDVMKTIQKIICGVQK